MRTKTFVIIALAFAAGGTCPSDVNNDGTVGINDFLQVLGDWGPCPNASVVAAAQEKTRSTRFDFQLWSDNTIRFRRNATTDNCYGCDESVPPNGAGWLIMDSPPTSATPVDIVTGPESDGLWVHYADGSAYFTDMDVAVGLPCKNGADTSGCEFVWTPWEEIK